MPVAQLAGVSSGAIAAVFYAAGFAPRRDSAAAQLATNVLRLTRPAFSRFGLLHLDAVEQLFARHLGSTLTFEDLQPAGDAGGHRFDGGRVGVFQHRAAAAAAAGLVGGAHHLPAGGVPGRQLVDGGLLNNLPVGAAAGPCRQSARGGRALQPHQPRGPHSQLSPLDRAHPAPGHQRKYGRPEKPSASCCSSRPELRHYRPLGYKRGPELFDIGYRYTMGQAAALHALVQGVR